MNSLIEDIVDNTLGFDLNEDLFSLPIESPELKIKISLKRKLEDDDLKEHKVQKNIFNEISCKNFLDFLVRFCKIALKHQKVFKNIEKWYLKQIDIFKLKSCEILYSIFLVIRDINNFVFIEKISDGSYKILNNEILKRVIKIVFNKNKIETWINSYNSIGVNIVKEDDRLLFK